MIHLFFALMFITGPVEVVNMHKSFATNEECLAYADAKAPEINALIANNGLPVPQFHAICIRNPAVPTQGA